ncbi:GNAT family N-acetyltransferase [Faecalicatena contorta]|uniref:GNAT family N-acetyltransferase n=1 Tax=Faecalicatena contorta TaxID=39482 RepID=UPI001F18F2A8|nr:GNAT family N-acetyltransferase [Faecalicatena contorta]MCF2555505.1 GNAT family N-acetyltransferase [Faecalicatena contorta]
MNEATLRQAKTDSEIQDIAILANEIWHQHFIPIIGEAQVEYMVEKFQSYPAIKSQIKNDGYEYYQIFSGHTMAGYTGIHQENNALFLSKLYIKKDFRGQHLATKALDFLIQLCKERGLGKIWLTCNKYNSNTLTVYDHLGFVITDEQVADIGNGFVMDDYILTYTVE